MNAGAYVRAAGAAFPLAVIRLMMAGMLLWAFCDKLCGLGLATPAGSGLLEGGSPTYDFLISVQGPCAGFFHALADHAAAVDVLTLLALLAIGLALLFGIATKIATWAGSALFLLFYLAVLPLSDNPCLDYHLLYIAALWAVYLGGGYACLGLADRWRALPLVQRWNWLA